MYLLHKLKNCKHFEIEKLSYIGEILKKSMIQQVRRNKIEHGRPHVAVLEAINFKCTVFKITLVIHNIWIRNLIQS